MVPRTMDLTGKPSDATDAAIFSTSTARLGGDDCAAGAAACVDRQDVTTNVAQWLMPLWGFDGSNEAVYDSTDLSGICLICSFRDDFQPATAYLGPSSQVARRDRNRTALEAERTL